MSAGSQRGGNASKSYAAWQKAGVVRADGRPFPSPRATARLWVPEQGGPGFLLGPNFYAVRSYNPSNNYALAIVHLADVVNGAELVAPKFPGGERPPTLAEIQEIQRRLTALGFDTKGADGRVGAGTMSAVSTYPAQDRHGAGRLCRRGAAGAVAAGFVSRVGPQTVDARDLRHALDRTAILTRLMLAARITFAHFSVSSTMNLPKACRRAGECRCSQLRYPRPHLRFGQHRH